jgi:hypothetical protein
MDIFILAVIEKNAHPGFLLPVDIWERVGHVKFLCKSELTGHPQRFISSPDVKMSKMQPPFQSAEIMIMVYPPVVEIPVGQFEDGQWKQVPSFDDADDDIRFTIRKIDNGNIYLEKEAGISDLLFISFEHAFKGHPVKRFAFREIKFPEDYLFLGHPVTDNKNMVDGESVGRQGIAGNDLGTDGRT